MQTFLEKVTEHLVKQEVDFSSTQIIFPGKRPILFFKKALIAMGYKGILPRMISLEDWVKEVSGFQKIEGVTLWLRYAKVYQDFFPGEPLEKMLRWIPTLLKDYDDLHTNLVDVGSFLDYMISTERIEAWGNVDQDQDFGSGAEPEFWNNQLLVYPKFEKEILHNQLAFSGLMFKKAAENLENYIKSTTDHFVFVGFNAFTESEQYMVKSLLEQDRAQVFWETDKYYLEDTKQEAGDFFRRYKNWRYYDNKSFDFIEQDWAKEKDIQTVGTVGAVNQAQFVSSYLTSQLESKIFSVSETAVVLADEALLPVLLNSFSSTVDKPLNITMGYPLIRSSVTGFLYKTLELHKERVENSFSEGKYYYQTIFDILLDHNFKSFVGEDENLFIQKVKRNNMSYVSTDFVEEHLLGSFFFPLLRTVQTPLEWLSNMTKWLEQFATINQEIDPLTTEVIFKFFTLFNALKELLTEFKDFSFSFSSFLVLMQELLNQETLSFVGEPLEGIQIMGLLETRLLNYKHIVMTSVNEGTLPLGRIENSLIPYDIRKKYKLNTFSETDAIYAYHFYRLLQKAEKITLVYNDSLSGLSTGEKSRFITQLEIETGQNIQSKHASPLFSGSNTDDLEIATSSFVLKRLDELFESGLSPSSINLYVREPMSFYLQKVLGIHEVKKIEEELSPSVLGSVVHKVLEELYKPYLNKVLLEQDFTVIQGRFQEVLPVSMKLIYGKTSFDKGKNYLAYKAIERMVQGVLDYDCSLVQKGQELVIQSLEMQLKAPFTLSDGKKIHLKGIIDRVDSLDGVTRLIDYKTGKVEERELRLEEKNLDKICENKEYSKVIQLSLYLYLYSSLQLDVISNLRAEIYPVKNIGLTGSKQLVYNKDFIFSDMDLQLIMEQIEKIVQKIKDPKGSFIKE